MTTLKKFQNVIGSLLELSQEDLKDFHEAADHDKKCKCDKCKKYYLIMKGQYRSSDNNGTRK